MKLIVLAALTLSAWAQTGLERPSPGMMLDASGAIRPVYGVPGSLVAGDAIATGVLSFACSRTMCRVSTVPALFALDGPTAWGYFPQSKQLARWRDGAWEYLNFTPDGEVLSIRSLGRVPEFAVRRDGGIQIVREDAVIDSLPNAAGAVMLLEDGVVFATADRVILRRADGTELNFDLQGAEAFFRMGEDYVQVRAAGTDYALRIERGHEQAFLLPQ